MSFLDICPFTVKELKPLQNILSALLIKLARFGNHPQVMLGMTQMRICGFIEFET